MVLNEELGMLNEKQNDRLKVYQSVFEKLFEFKEEINAEELNSLCSYWQNDIKAESSELQELCLNNLLLLFEDDNLKILLSDSSKENLMKSLITLLNSSQEEKVVSQSISILNATLISVKLSNDLVKELLVKIDDLVCKSSLSVSVYSSLCLYIQRLFKQYEAELSSLMSAVPRLIFLPLVHKSLNVREVAEKTLNMFPKVVLYSENEVFCSILLKLVKEHYCKDLLELFKDKQELYCLKIWKHIVNSLGRTLHSNLLAMTPFFQIIEKGFKSSSDDVVKMAFLVWKCLISNFALDENVLNDSKKLRFVLKPFKNLSRCNESTSLAICDTWWHLAWSLSHNLSSRFTEVCIPLLDFAMGRTLSGSHEKTAQKSSQIVLVKRSCHLLLRMLEQPQSTNLNRISSPKKLPPVIYPSLQVPIDQKVIIRHFKDICSVIKAVLESLKNSKEMSNHIECLMKSALFVVSITAEDRSKEPVEAVTAFLSLVSDITDSQLCSSLVCLKCIDSLSKLPRSTLTSHCYNGGFRKSQDILCTTLLKLLLDPYLLTKETPKRFLAAYNRLVQTGLCESLNPLSMAQKFTHCLKVAASPGIMDSEVVFDMWSGIASPLLENIEKTQEVNQGDKREHDFSCLYDVLLCPFEHIFPINMMQQFRNKPSFQLWANLYKAFIRCSALVPTTVPNEACEEFCSRLKNAVKEDLLKEPHYFETVCFVLQSVFESVDSSSAGGILPPVNVLSSPSLMSRKKRPLGNLASAIELLSSVISMFHDHYLNAEEDIYQSCAPKAQRKNNISKTAVPVDLVKMVFTSVITGPMIPSALEILAEPLSKVFLTNQKKTSTSALGAKLEVLWSTLASFIEMHFMGPYDSDFLATMSPLLEALFSHPRRQIKERCKRFWFATFAPVSSSLNYSESLKNTLKKAKVTHAPDENISTLEDVSYAAGSGTLEESFRNFNNVCLKDTFAKPSEVLTPKKKEEKKSEKIEIKSTPKSQNSQPKSSDLKSTPVRNIDELPSSDFVQIDVANSLATTPKRRSIRKRKSFVPALYNDLSQSQDTNTLFGSSDSFDTASSSDVMEIRSQMELDKASVLQKETPKDEVLKTNDESNKASTSETNNTENNSCEIIPSNSEKESSEMSLELPNENNDQSAEALPSSEKNEISSSGNLNQPGTISDSDEIIPSSQSSAEIESFIKFPAIEEAAKKIVESSTPAVQSIESEEINANDLVGSTVCIVTESPVSSPIENDENNYECPETPMDIDSTPSSENGVLAIEDSMPLKSSENIKNSEEQSLKNKTSQNDIKGWIENSEEFLKSTVNYPKNSNLASNNVCEIIQSSITTIDSQLFENKDIISDPLEIDDIPLLPTRNAKRGLIRNSLDNVTLRTTVKRQKARKSLPGALKRKTKQIHVDKYLHDVKEDQESDVKESNGVVHFENLTVNISDASDVSKSAAEEPDSDIASSKNVLNVNAEESQNIPENNLAEINDKVTNCLTLEKRVTRSSQILGPDLTERRGLKRTHEDIDLSQPNQAHNSEENLEAVQEKECTESVSEKDGKTFISGVKCKDLDSVDENVLLKVEKSGAVNLIPAPESNVCASSATLAADDDDDQSKKKLCIKISKQLVNKEPLRTSKRKTKCASNEKVVKNNVINDLSSDENVKNASLTDQNNEEIMKQTCLAEISEVVDNVLEAVTVTVENGIDQIPSDAGSNEGYERNAENILNTDDPRQVTTAVELSDINNDLTITESCVAAHVEVEANAPDSDTLLVRQDEQPNEIISVDSQSEIPDTPIEMLQNPSLPVATVESVVEVDVSGKSSSEEVLICDKNIVLESEDIFQELPKISLEPEEHRSFRTSDIYDMDKESHCHNDSSIALHNDSSDGSEKVFSDDLELKGIEHDISEITEVVNTILNDSVLKVSQTEVKDLNEEEVSGVEEEINQSIDDLQSQFDSAPAIESPESQNLVDVLHPNVNEMESSPTSDDNDENKSWEDVQNSVLDGIALSSEITCFPIPKRKKNTTNCEQSSTQIERGSAKRRKGKYPKKSLFNEMESSQVLVSKNNFSPEKQLPTNSKLTLSKLGKRSMSKDPVPNKSKKLNLLQNGNGISENIPTCKKQKKTLISCHVLGKTGLEVKITEPNGSSKNIKELKNDELTDMYTRFNASSGTETRRFKMLAASQQSLVSIKQEGVQNGVSNEEHVSNKPSSSILKKRKTDDDFTPVKYRKVTFAHPLVEEKLFRSDESISVKVVTVNIKTEDKETEVGNVSSAVLEKTSKSNDAPVSSSADSVSSSSEYQNSDNVTVYNPNPVSPALINCQDDISCILKDLTSPAWTKALETVLLSRDIKTIGDLCKLNFHELKILPLKSPKLQTLHKAISSHITRSQKLVEQKFKESEGSLNDSSLETSVNDTNTTMNEENGYGVLEAIAKSLLDKDNIKQISKNTLIELSRKCFAEVTEKLENA